MDLITRNELDMFLDTDLDWCVSLFMPAHRTGRETEQDPIVFKNLLREAEQGLLAKGLRSVAAREALKPAQDLLENQSFWRHQSDGLAMFAAPEVFRAYRLPLAFEKLVMVSDRFHFKPLLPFFANDRHFYVLALSQNEVRLLEGTRHTVDEVVLEDTLPDLAEALKFDQFNKNLQFHTGTASTSGGDRGAMYHGHDPSDDDKSRILRWFHKINDELSGALSGEDSPLVLAGVEYLFPLYQEANTYPHLVEQGIPGNPEELSAETLHAQAWPLVRPIFMAAQEQAAAEYRKLAGTGQAANDVPEVVFAAHQGRVAALFVAVGRQVVGRFDPKSQSVVLAVEEDSTAGDLLNLAALLTLKNGGSVYAVEPEQVPGEGTLAAVLRW